MILAEMFLLIFIFASIYLVISFFWPLLSGGAGYTPTPKRDIRQALELCELNKNDTFYDLGSGFGKVLVEASKLCPNTIGIEIEPLRWFISKLRVRKAKVILGNLFKQNLEKATIVFLFQYRGKINKDIGVKLRKELKSGTRVISYLYEIDGWKYDKRLGNLYYYKV
jgi:hypothetical protein